MLSLKNIHKSFGSNEVLKGIGFELKQGEKIVILGPSGSGKSTILRCINHLEEFQEGEISFKGKKVSRDELNSLRTHIGMVFQRFNIFSHMTVLENIIEAPVHVKKMKKADAIELAEDLLKKVGLEDKRDSYAKELSGGQQQRVAIARALAMQPDIMLFDEPTSALDPELVGEVLRVMKAVADAGMSMIVVTHEIGFARDVADRVVFVDGGKILDDKPPEEFFNNQKNERIRSFLSKISLK
ncbi:MAG: amino acid ABC transporter ATP-binding protein [Oscillospiraceae bacterium]|nr:amino acid ABC transporter ATP-binding protein [Oscillospiraceae bacterium]MCI1990490.1 amino acid ABC transporter ATP-binding protein [Oscillospiraceae bacterium]MCI2034654.1 amino acid ABC transporter ATP-binding protein [Oscillospiraceae bacterium]